MAGPARYCKAYLLKDFRKFDGWAEDASAARKEIQEFEGQEIEAPRELTDNSIVYIHETFVVTDGIYIDENILFDEITQKWKSFCRKDLKFKIPVYKPLKIKPDKGDAKEDKKQAAGAT